MAILYQNISYNNSRFPRPKTRITQPNVFPSDLNTNGRGFYTHISFKEYNFPEDILPNVFSGGFGAVVLDAINVVKNLAITAGSAVGIDKSAFSFKPSLEIKPIMLPIPKKINDNFTFSWNDQSVLEKVAPYIPGGRTISSGIATSSFMTGVTINPFLFMFFQRPNFKEFVLQWTLTPNTPRESETVNKIIDSLQKASLPTKVAYGGLLKYPHVLEIQLYPQEFGDQMMFKLCAITSVQVDYTGAGSPSFFKDTNLPTVVTLSLSLKEIELWDSTEIEV